MFSSPRSGWIVEDKPPRRSDVPDRRISVLQIGTSDPSACEAAGQGIETEWSDQTLGIRYGLQIRAASSTDAAGIAELMKAAGRPVDTATIGTRLDGFRQDAGVALLALEWGPPSGLIVLNWYRTLNADLPVAQISTLLVGPDDRRRGIGRTLLKAGAQAARSAGCGTLYVSASVGDATLAAFCIAAGFSEGGTSFERPLRKKV
jgi:aminoglycoside 6'-N-acetyltransferase I